MFVLRIALWLDFAINLLYGLELLLLPAMLVETGGSTAPDFGWLRWSGGVLLAVAYGCFRVIRKPKGQDVFVTTIIVMGFLNSLEHPILGPPRSSVASAHGTAAG